MIIARQTTFVLYGAGQPELMRRVAIQRPRKVVGTDPVGAMQSGVFWGYIALIEGLIARIKAVIVKLVHHSEESGGRVKLSQHLDSILHKDYSSLSALFSRMAAHGRVGGGHAGLPGGVCPVYAARVSDDTGRPAVVLFLIFHEVCRSRLPELNCLLHR